MRPECLPVRKPVSGLTVSLVGATVVTMTIGLSSLGSFRGSLGILLVGLSLPTVVLLLWSGLELPAAICAGPVVATAAFVACSVTAVAFGMPLSRTTVACTIGALTAAAVVAVVMLRPGVRRPTAGDLGTAAIAMLVSLATALAGIRAVGPFPPTGSDWGSYLLYAETAARAGRLLLMDPYGFGGGFPFSGDPGVAALLGSLKLTDGMATDDLITVLPIVHAFLPLTIFAATYTLWGRMPAVAAAIVAAIAPVGWQIFGWHGLSLQVGLVLLPLVLLWVASILLQEDTRAWIPLGLVLAGLISLSRPTAVFAYTFVGLAMLVEAVRSIRSAGGRAVISAIARSRPITGLAQAGVLGALLAAGAVFIFARQTEALGKPPPARDFRARGLLDVQQVVTTNSRAVFLTAAISVVVILLAGAQAHAMRPVVLYVVAAIVVSQFAVVGISYEYTRPASFLGIALIFVIAAALSVARGWQHALLLGCCLATVTSPGASSIPRDRAPGSSTPRTSLYSGICARNSTSTVSS